MPEGEKFWNIENGEVVVPGTTKTEGVLPPSEFTNAMRVLVDFASSHAAKEDNAQKDNLARITDAVEKLFPPQPDEEKKE